MRKYITDYSSKAFYSCIFLIYFVNFLPLTLNLEIYFLLRYGSSRDYSLQNILIYFLYVIAFSIISTASSFEFKSIFISFSNIIKKLFYWIYSSFAVRSFTLIALISKLILFIKIGLYSRHDDVFRVQSTGFLGIAYTFTVYYLQNYLLFETIYYFSQRDSRSKKQKISFICALLGYMILINSSLTTILLLIVIIYNFNWLRELDFSREIKRIFIKSKIKFNFIVLIIFIPALTVISISAGFINKSISSFNNALTDVNGTILNVFVRLTTHSDSLFRLINGCDLECKFFNPFSGILWRLSYLLDKSSYAGEILTPNRINFLNTFSEVYAERFDTAGSSPGILASFLLGEPILITFIFVLLICGYFIFNMRLMFRSIGFSFKSFILYLLAFLITLASPLDYLLIFTPSLLTIVFLGVYGLRVKKRDEVFLR